MQNIKKISIWLIVLNLLSASCVTENRKPEKAGLNKLDWFIGSWSGQTSESIFTESWVKVNNTLYSGQSYFIKGSDTLSRETISLQQHDTSLFYVPLVEGQNGNKPVYFRLTFSDSVNAVFENPEHDFPQKIAYHLKPGDSLIATISGNIEGKIRSIRFPMSPQKDSETRKPTK
jgi:hypothetical protein